MPINAINTILKSLDSSRYLSTTVSLFIKINRADLCFYLPNQQKVMKILHSKLSQDAIVKSSIRTMCIDKIIDAHKFCQKDYASLVSFYESCENKRYSLYDYLEDRKSALFCLVKDKGFSDDAREYAAKYGLYDELLMYTYYSIFDIDFYGFVAQHKEPMDAYHLYLASGCNEEASKIAVKNLFWREALSVDFSETSCHKFISLLDERSRFSESGEILEKYLKDTKGAVEHYLNGKSFRRALALFKRCDSDKEEIGEIVRSAAINGIRDSIQELDDLVISYEKYRNRLIDVRNRLKENMDASQTTFSYTSFKSSRNALRKDRPGGVFENEYVMDKIKNIVISIVEWKNMTDELMEISGEFGEQEWMETRERAFKKVKSTLRAEIDDIWDYKRSDCDIEMPIVSKPEIPENFDESNLL